MNLPLPAPPAEIPAHPLADAVRTADEIESQLRRFVRQLRLSAERDLLAGKDVNT